MGTRQSVKLSSLDNVETALQDLDAGMRVGVETKVALVDDIPYGHKFAIDEIGVGEPVIKYGTKIGTALRTIRVGEHVHVHNVKEIVEDVRSELRMNLS